MIFMKVVDADISGYGSLRLPSLDPPVILSYEIKESTCDEILAAMDKAVVGSSKVYETTESSEVNTYHRSSSYHQVEKSVYERVSSLIVTAVQRLCLHQLEAKSIFLSEPLQFLRYDAASEGHFNMHTDSAFMKDGAFYHTSPHRLLTSLLYLNDDFEGGELEVGSVLTSTGKPLKIKPGKGLLVVFPSDVRFPHQAHVVKAGTRSVVVGWFNVAWSNE